MENIYEKILYIKNKPLFEQTIPYLNHKIFYKYTSVKYYKYIFDLLDTLCKRSPYENRSHIFHLSLSFIFKILFKCENIPHLSNLDLVILNCFSLGIKSLTKQKLFPSITKLKKIYEEKYKTYTHKEILDGEIICLKLLDFNINILTPYEYIEYILCDNPDNLVKKHSFENLEDMLINNIEFILYNKPFDIAQKCVNEVRTKKIIKEPKIIIKKIISTKTFNGNNIKKCSSSDEMINSKDENKKENNNRDIIEKLKRKNNLSISQNKKNFFTNNIKINIKCSPEKIYYKKNFNCNIIHQNSSGSITTDNNNRENIISHQGKIFKKKINKSSVSKNRFMYKSNNMTLKNKFNLNAICQKKLYLNNNNRKTNDNTYYENTSLNDSNNQFFRKTNNIKNNQPLKENDKNNQNLSFQRNHSGSRNVNNPKKNKYSVVSVNVNNYKNNKAQKYEIETKNIKLNYINKRHLAGSDYKKGNNENRLTQIHNQLNSSENFFNNSLCSKDDYMYENQSIGNYYIKW